MVVDLNKTIISSLRNSSLKNGSTSDAIFSKHRILAVVQNRHFVETRTIIEVKHFVVAVKYM